MTTPITVPVTFPGAQDSTAVMAALANAVAGLGDKVGDLSTKQADNTQKTETAAQAAARLRNEQQQAALGAVAFAQRVAGVANAVQGLTSRLGSRDQTAGLIGSVVATTAQFAAMGSALGPAGAVGGAVAGFIISINELAAAHDAAAVAATAHADAERQLQQATSAALDSAIRTGGDLSHADAHQLAVAAQARLNEIAAIQQQITEIQESHAVGSLSLATGLTGAQDALALARGEGSVDHRVQTLQTRIESLQREIQHIDSATPGSDAIPTVSGAHIGAGPGGPTDDDVTRLTGRGGVGSPHAEASDDAKKAEALAEQARIAADAVDDLAAARAEAHDAIMEQIGEETGALEAQGEEKRALMHEQQEQQRRYQEQLRHYTEQRRRWDEEESRSRAAQTQEAQGAATAIIGNLTNVFTLMAEGQANAAQGAELLLAGFLQYISQRATIEALAQVAQGIGSYPDFGGMALHFAAAAAWGAVAVATGVGGAALASDAQGQAAQAQSQAKEKPASPESGAGAGAEKGATYVINWNAPVVTGQTEAQLGRTMRRMVDRATQRFPTG